jgi:hypothetical protein
MDGCWMAGQQAAGGLPSAAAAAAGRMCDNMAAAQQLRLQLRPLLARGAHTMPCRTRTPPAPALRPAPNPAGPAPPPLPPQVSPTGEQRELVTAVAILLAILTLVPMAPELADSVGIGGGDSLFY